MEIEIVEALQNGDHKAFEDIFIAYLGKVKYFLILVIKSNSKSGLLLLQGVITIHILMCKTTYLIVC